MRFEVMEFLRPRARRIEEIAIFTDGLENLVLQKAGKAVHAPFFDSMFPAGAALDRRRASMPELVAGARRCTCRAPPVNDRTDDDKTLILASRRRA